MASKVEMQYKLLNSELMEQVQKQRLEIGEYRKRVITLERENMDLRRSTFWRRIASGWRTSASCGVLCSA